MDSFPLTLIVLLVLAAVFTQYHFIKSYVCVQLWGDEHQYNDDGKTDSVFVFCSDYQELVSLSER